MTKGAFSTSCFAVLAAIALVAGCAATTEEIAPPAGEAPRPEATHQGWERADPGVHRTTAGGDPSPETPPEDVTPDAILKKLATCKKMSSAPFAKDASGAGKIDVCGLKNAVFFKADLDVDCDGKKSAVCNSSADASWQPETATTDSKGKPLDASKLPYIVVPGASSRWNYRDAGIALGSVGLVIYDGKMEYGIVGDIGPKAIIGEASYAMAESVGIDPDPSTGGASTGVTYVIFTGKTAVVDKNEDHAEAVTIGKKRAAQLLNEN